VGRLFVTSRATCRDSRRLYNGLLSLRLVVVDRDHVIVDRHHTPFFVGPVFTDAPETGALDRQLWTRQNMGALFTNRATGHASKWIE
jgi:hypothetical protein